MKFGDFLNTMAAKLSLQNDPQLVSLLSNAQLAQMDIDDTFANKMNAGLMSLDGAKSNMEVKKHFDASALNAIDAKLLPLAQQYGAAAEFDTEKSTYKRVDILAQKIAAKIAEVESKAASGDITKDAEVKRLNGELQNLQGKLTSLTSDKDREIADLKSSHAKAMLDSLVDFALSGKSYANDQLDTKTNVTIARTLLQSELAKRGAIIVNDNGALRLKNANAPELDLLDEGNKPVSFEGFTDKFLADKSLLKVSPATQQPQKPRQTITFQTSPGTNQNQPDMSQYNAAVQRSLNDMATE